VTGNPGYRWRDPARLTPERIADLAAHDARLRLLEQAPVSLEAHRAADRTRKQLAGYTSDYDRVTQLRADGAGVRDAADQVGMTWKTGWRYEARRKKAAG
jgi:multidrug resistance efflux pump